MMMSYINKEFADTIAALTKEIAEENGYPFDTTVLLFFEVLGKDSHVRREIRDAIRATYERTYEE
jgi:hypothetical protein